MQNFGSTLRASIKSQINLEINAVEGIKNAEGLRDMILPVAWMVEETNTLDYPEAVKEVMAATALPGRTKQGLYVLFFFGGTVVILAAVAIILWVKLELSGQKLRAAATTTADTCRQFVPEFVAKRMPEWTLAAASPTPSETSTETAATTTAKDKASQDPMNQK